MTRALLVLAALLGATGCASSRYLARVNGEEITGPQMKKDWGRRHRGFEKYLATESEVRSVLQASVDRRLLLQEARRIGLQDNPDIKARVEALRTREMIAALIKAEIEDPAQPSDAEIAAAYEKLGKRYLVREVVVAEKEKAEELRIRALAGEDFEELAAEYSIARSRGNRGAVELRWGWPDEAFEVAALALGDGDISPVVLTAQGWTVLKLEAARPVEKPPFEPMKERIRSVLQRRKAEVLDREFLAALRRKYAAETKDCGLALATLKKAKETEDARVCATWQGGRYTVSELARNMKLEPLETLPADKLGPALDTKVSDLVAEKLFELEARARQLDQLPGIVEDVEREEAELMVDMVLGRYIAGEVVVTPGEVHEYYQGHKAEMVTPEERLLSQIVVDTDEQLKKAQDRLAAGEPFERVAVDLTKVKEQAMQGGAVGWFKRADVPDDLASLFTAAQGDVVGPLRQRDGIHLVKIVQVKPSVPLTQEAAEARIRSDLVSARTTERYERFIKELRAHSEIEVSEAGIRRYLKDNPIPTVPRDAPVMKGGMGAMAGPGGAPPSHGAH